MQSVVELIVHAPQAEVAALFFDPRNAPQWMHDVARVEPLRGDLGAPGSSYRLVPKGGSADESEAGFVATVVDRKPTRLDLLLERSDVSVAIGCKLVRLADEETQLISEETFRFKGLVAKVFGWFARRSIDDAHRAAMGAFKRFAERRRGRTGEQPIV